MDREPVSIIIPNFNGAVILANNLPSVVAAARSYGDGVEIIVVDDASADHSALMVAERFPQVELVRHEDNRGFAEAVHSGVHTAAHEILVILNSDVRPDGDFLEPLIETLMRNRDVFAASPLVYDPEGRVQNVSWNRYKMVRGTIKSAPWDMTTVRTYQDSGRKLKSLFASGGSIALKKERFNRLSGFLPIYKPFYIEDMDLCTRAWMHGWQTLLEPRSKVVHDHVGTIKRHFHAKQIRMTLLRNRLYYLWLYCSRRRLLLSHIPWTILRLLHRLLLLEIIFPGALINSLWHLRSVVALRAQIQRGQPFKPLEEILKEIESE
jgi:GT2 family glycosyltransferase